MTGTTADPGTPRTAFGRDLVIDRETLRHFLRRTDRHGLIHLGGHLGLLLLTGTAVWHTAGSPWLIPAMAVHAIVMAFLFAPVHECSHGSAFRTRRLNEAVYWLVCLIYLVPPTMFRHAHAAHHTWTQVRGQDPDMLPERMTLLDYGIYISGYYFWKRNLGWFLRHPLGIIDSLQRRYVPDKTVPRIVREARIILLVYAGIAALSVATGSTAPLLLWISPRLLGEPFMRWLRIAEHGECAETGDLRHNTRTTDTSRLIRWLFWNMPYHAEHHLCPMVPFHALGRLHRVVGERLHPIGRSYPAVHAEVLGKISRHGGVTWENSPGDVGRGG